MEEAKATVTLDTYRSDYRIFLSSAVNNSVLQNTRNLDIGDSGSGVTYYLVVDGLENLPPPHHQKLLEFFSARRMLAIRAAACACS
ncbi:hypothetical protein F4801DRAFT_575445 [Xylaria longipes]|nr:hypothetical protein F4801DRAFT_575445 [Xylaria longipes]